MKKILLLTLFLLFATVSSSFATPLYFEDSGISMTGVSASSLAWGDYDNDGDLDLVVCGYNSSTITTIIYENTGGDFAAISTPALSGINASSLAWGDYDNDGDLDLAVCGNEGPGGITTKIYHNDGGTFADIEADLSGVYDSSLDWGDYDNDGDLDLAVCGNTGLGDTTIIYINNSEDTFIDIGADLTGVDRSSLAWGDYDNDGDLDLAVCGNIGGSVGITKIYQNNNGTFIDISAGLTGVYDGSLAWGDYDNDGDLDLAVSGWSGANITKIYQNTGGTFTENTAAGLTGACYSFLAWGDYDNDGNLDLAVCGWSGGPDITKIYNNDNDGDGVFDDIEAVLTGVRTGSLAWGDYDNDGDLDLAVCGNNTGPAGYITKIYENLEVDLGGGYNPNTIPSAPTNLTYESGSTILKWDPGSDNETPADGLYYNLRLGTTPEGNDIVSGIYGSPLLGNYLRPKLSDSQLGVRLGDLPNGTYYWSVQTIDTSLKASGWSDEESLLVGPSGPAEHHGEGEDNGRFGITGCFIATACFGTQMADEVRVLSGFRDECLLTNPVGTIFVKTYYKISPPLADFIAEHPMLKNVVGNALKPLIWMAKEFED